MMHPEAQIINDILLGAEKGTRILFLQLPHGVQVSYVLREGCNKNQHILKNTNIVFGRLLVATGMNFTNRETPESVMGKFCVDEKEIYAEAFFIPKLNESLFVIDIIDENGSNRPEIEQFFETYSSSYVAYIACAEGSVNKKQHVDVNAEYRLSVIRYFISHQEQHNSLMAKDVFFHESLYSNKINGLREEFPEFMKLVLKNYHEGIEEILQEVMATNFDAYLLLKSMRVPEKVLQKIKRAIKVEQYKNHTIIKEWLDDKIKNNSAL